MSAWLVFSLSLVSCGACAVRRQWLTAGWCLVAALQAGNIIVLHAHIDLLKGAL